MKLSEKQAIFSKNIASLIVYAGLLGIDLTFGDAFRNEFTQKEYVRTGLSQTLDSQHRKRLDNRWGGDFNKNGVEDGFIDTPHFEMQ